MLVAVEHFGGDVRPGIALGALARGGGHARAARGREREPAQRLGERERVAGGQQLAVDTVAQDVAVAGDVGGEHGGGGGEGLGQDHAEALAVQRRRAQHIGAGELGQLALLGDLAERVDAAIVEHHVGDLLAAGADERERRRNVVAQRLEGAQQDRQALALDGLTDEEDPQLTLRGMSSAPRYPSRGEGDVGAPMSAGARRRRARRICARRWG